MIILIRHCSAEGQEQEAKLTEKGLKQATELSKSLSQFLVPTRIITSPFRRAIQSVEPLANLFNITIECDELLRERFLCDSEDDEHKVIEYLKESFINFDFKATPNGESNRDCQERAIKFLENLHRSYTPEQVIILVSHGNFTATLLNLVDPNFGYEQMMTLTNPDIFLLEFSNEDKLLSSCQRIWNGVDVLDIKT